MNTKLLLGAVVGAAMLLSVPAANADGGKKYRVTITNLTAGQPLTPPILVTHNRRADLFTLGEEASAEIQAIAENGNGAPMQMALSGDANVHEVVSGGEPVVPANNPGGTPFPSSVSFEITARGSARYLSWVSMLICTNDGFTGLDGIRLPYWKTTVYSAAYDARTETNTEDFVDMVPPCQGLIGVSTGDDGTGMSNPALAEDGIVIPHPGISGGVDLFPEVHGWTDPVAKIEIERIRN